jgi:hypothetical protein
MQALGNRPGAAMQQRLPQSRSVAASVRVSRKHFGTAPRVAAVEQQQTAPAGPEGASQVPEAQEAAPIIPEVPVANPSNLLPVDEEQLAQLELAELDSAQEQLLAWMLTSDEEQQEADLDEMVDYDEFADDEYEALFEEVEQLVDSRDLELKVGDKVVGTVYEVDEDGAYVEIGEKASGFVPLAECSFAKLKTVRGGPIGQGLGQICSRLRPCHNPMLNLAPFLPVQPLEVLRVGMKREFVVVEPEDDYGQTVLSLAAMEVRVSPLPAAQLALGAALTGYMGFWVQVSVFWARIRQLQEEDMTVYVKVDSANKGGLLVKYGPYDGFIPVSQFGPVRGRDMCCDFYQIRFGPFTAA